MNIKKIAKTTGETAVMAFSGTVFLGYCLVKSVPIVINDINQKVADKIFG